MTRTTSNLSELLPRFEKPRGDARGMKNDKAPDSERATAKAIFGNLVKQIDGETGSVEKRVVRPENESKLVETTAKLEAAKLRDQEPLRPPLQGASSTLSQSKPALQDAPKLASPLADNGSDAGKTSVHRHGQTPGGSRRDDPEMVNTTSNKSEALLSQAAPVAANVERKGRTEAIARMDPAPAETAVEEGFSEKKMSTGEPKIDAENADVRTVVLSEAAAPDSNSDSASAKQEPIEVPVATSFENSAETEQVEQLAAGPDRPVTELRSDTVEPRQTSEAKTVPDVGPRHEPVADRIASEAYYALRRAPTSVTDSLDRPAEIAGHKRAVAQLSPWSVTPDRPELKVRLARGTASDQRVLSEPLAVPPTAGRPELKARLVHETASAQRALSEALAVPALPGRPEQTVRFTQETARAQRTMGVNDQEVVTDNDIELATSDLQIKGVKQEVHRAMGPSAGVGTVSVYGQLVQSIASPDGLPRAAPELQLLATQGSTTSTPEPLKVLHIQLQPKELGDVAVRIALRGDKIELRVQTARQATANLLMSDQRLLVEALQQKNFDIDSVTIQLVDPDRNSSAQSAALPNAAQARSGQSESFLAGSQGQASRQNGGAGRQDGNSDAERRNQRQEGKTQDGVGQRRGLYL